MIAAVTPSQQSIPELDRHHFDHLLPARPMLQVKDVVAALGTSSTFVEQLADSGQLAVHRLNAGRGSRMTIRIPRGQVILYLLKTRSVEPALHLAGVLSLLEALSLYELTVIQDKMPSLAEAARLRVALPAPLSRDHSGKPKVKCKGSR